MKKALFLIITLLYFLNNVKAQYYNDLNVNGKPVMLKTAADVTGSPYMYEDWINGSVKLKSGKSYNVLLKYNLLDDALIYKNSKDEVMEFVDDVKEFTLSQADGTSENFRNGFSNIQGWNDKSYFKVLSEGNSTLLKKERITIQETTDYNAGMARKNYAKSDTYYLVSNTGSTQLKINKKAILSRFSTRQKEMTDYMASNSIDIKNDGDLSKLFNYYNSLIK
jgi:hypothetical protein